ncbi:MAG: response regulator [Endomicrobia bacterium]|nr:response regulator [Endomicrobiia bacterium]MCL2799257.1 response regulator [Endomicrobiia bacterium]
MADSKKTIALADDDANVRSSLARTIQKHFADIEIIHFSNTVETKKYILNNPDKIDLLILDIHFGMGETGLDILPDIKKYSPALSVILLSAMEKTYGQEVSDKAGDYIIDFMSKPVTETELIIKIKKALLSKDDKTKKLEKLESENALLSEMLSSQDDGGAGGLFEKEVLQRLYAMTKVFMQKPYEPKENIIINGQEIDVLAFTAAPLPFSIMVFETKYFPNAKVSGGANEPMRVFANGIEKVSTKRRNLFEQSENQFKQVSKRIEKILKESGFAKYEEIYRPFIQTFIVFPDSTDISGIETSNANRYTKICKFKDLTPDFIIKTAFAMPKRQVGEDVKKIILEKLF